MAEKKYTPKYWNSEVARAEERHKTFLESAKESIKVYNTEHHLDDVARRLSVWWYLVNTLLPAYYSRIPKAEVSLRKKSGQAIHQLAAISIERFTQYALDEELRFDGFGLDAAQGFLLTGRAVGWVRYEADTEEQESEYGVIRGADGKLYGGDNEPYEGDESAVEETESGLIVRQTIEAKVGERVILECLNYADYLVGPGRNQTEVEWRSRDAYLSREQAIEKFGKKVANDLKYDCVPEEIRKSRSKDLGLYEGKAKLREIWCRESGKVYWLQQGGEKSILEEGDPPIRFADFWPCVEITASTDPDTVIPTSDYVQVKDQILEVERLTTRIAATTQAIRANGLYDATLGDHVESLLTGDLKLKATKNWPSYKSKGGLAAGIEFLNVEQYVNALSTLQAARDVALQRLYESMKAADIVRGVTDPRETATAQDHKSRWASLGLSVRQERFARFMSDCIGKVAEVMCEQFSPEKLADMADAEALIAQAQQAGQQVTWEQIHQVIKADHRRRYRIQIAADSLVQIDERAERQERTDYVASVGSFLGQIVPFVEKYPPMAPYALQLMQFVNRSYKAGKELEEPILGTMKAITQIAQQQSQQQGQQPPDPRMMEAQAKMQQAQMDQQIQQQKMQMEMVRLEFEGQQNQLQAQIELEKVMLERERMALERVKLEQEAQLKLLDLERQLQKDQAQLKKELLDTQQAAITAQGAPI